MAATTRKEPDIQGSTNFESAPCGAGLSSVSPSQVPYLAASPAIECGSCGEPDRPLWWGICGWCGADEEDFEDAA